ncbi:MAG: BrnT family toxin [Desulfamplus sp.]|nr:BrnT family toxin [Desulfamplus sp.]MBF0389831.1 BrnT family toxin [Desulfamplus sp.]
MKFEWNENKNQLNIKNHKIDFNDVVEMFSKPMLINIDERFDYGEDRYIGIGLLKNFIAFVVFIEKIDKDSIRIISARKANKNEIRFFKENIKD